MNNEQQAAPSQFRLIISTATLGLKDNLFAIAKIRVEIGLSVPAMPLLLGLGELLLRKRGQNFFEREKRRMFDYGPVTR